MRIVFGGNQCRAQIDVYDAAERALVGKASYSRADVGISDNQSSNHQRLLEFSSEEKDQEV
jgi:hypothetical protein